MNEKCFTKIQVSKKSDVQENWNIFFHWASCKWIRNASHLALYNVNTEQDRNDQNPTILASLCTKLFEMCCLLNLRRSTQWAQERTATLHKSTGTEQACTGTCRDNFFGKYWKTKLSHERQQLQMKRIPHTETQHEKASNNGTQNTASVPQFQNSLGVVHRSSSLSSS